MNAFPRKSKPEPLSWLLILKGKPNIRPLHYDDFEMNRFGYFREERLVWDKDYGFTYDGVRKMVNRHDIFKKDENGKIIGVKPVIYHLNIGYPNDLIDEANGLAAEWSRAFDAAVKAATGKLPYELPAYHANGQPMLKDDGSAVHVPACSSSVKTIARISKLVMPAP